MEHQRACDRHTLLLASRQLAGIAVLVSRQTHEAKHLLNASLDLVGRPALQREAECDIVENGQMRKQSVVLEYHAKTALLGRDAVDAPIVVPDLAFGWRNEAGDDAECGRFSTPAGPKEGNELASADFERQAVEDGLAAVALGDGHPQVA